MNHEHQRKTILVVDDIPDNIAIATSVLKDIYGVQTALNGEEALAKASRKPDLILLDVQMPGIDGYEVCQRLKANPDTNEIPVVFLTTLDDQLDEARGFMAGAVDFIHKPISPSIVRMRVATHLNLKEARDQLALQKQVLEEKVKQRTAEITLIQDATIGAMAALAEARDNETGNHIKRTQHYVKHLAMRLRTHPRFEAELTPEAIEMLFKSAPLHDIGKVGIPDHILLKPGQLDANEFAIMKMHAAIGAITIEQAESQLASNSKTFLSYARDIAMFHHEKWDGSGYPGGLKEENIPISARLMAISDVYDALISKRVYKPAFPHEKAVAIIVEGRGKHFDPVITDTFLAIQDDFHVIAQNFYDHEG